MIEAADLQQFTGSESFFRHPLNRKVIYTEGVQYLAKNAGAYWLIDAIASHFGSEAHRNAAASDLRIDYLHFWTLCRNDNGGATLVAKADSPEDPFIQQDIEFTDFPLDKIDIWVGFDGQHWTLYLPSEH